MLSGAIGAGGEDYPLVVSGENGLWRVEPEAGIVAEWIDGRAVSAIAFGPGGNLFALAGDRVLEYDGTSYALLGTFIPESADLSGSAAIAAGGDGRLYAARGDTLRAFEAGNSSPVAAESFSGSGISEISGLAAREGDLVLADAPGGRVFAFDPEAGTLETIFDRTGYPGHLALDNSGEWATADGGERPALVRVSGQDRRLHGFFERDLPAGTDPAGFRGVAFAGEALVTCEIETGALLRFPLDAMEPAARIESGGWGEVTDLATAPSPADPAETYADWRHEHFSGEDLDDDAVSGPEADPAGDGFANLLRFAFGAGREPLPRERLPRPATVADGGERFVEIRFVGLRRLAGSGLRIEVAAEPGEWESGDERLSVVEVENLGDLQGVTIRDTRPLAGRERRFYRLRIVIEEDEP